MPRVPAWGLRRRPINEWDRDPKRFVWTKTRRALDTLAAYADESTT